MSVLRRFQRSARRQLGLRGARCAAVTASAVAVGSLLVLLAVSSHGGLVYTWKDPYHYLTAARSFAQGDGLYISHYRVAEDRVVREPLTHFPPLVSSTYGVLMLLGIDPHTAPAVANCGLWLLFLAGLAVLTLRLARSAAAAVYVLALGSVTWPYLDVFLSVSSEPLFLVVLVWWVAAATGLPRQGSIPTWQMAAVVGLGALLPLSRYVGVFFLPTLAGWWLVRRWRANPRRRIVAEIAALASTGVPLVAWLARNWLLTETLVGKGHAGDDGHGLIAGIESIVTHLTWLLLPTVRPGPLWRQLGLVAAVPLVAVAILLASAAWSGGRRREERVATPIPWLLSAYLAVFTFLQPLMAFTPMNRRFATVVLCLGVPWLVALCSRAPARLFHAAIASLIGVGGGLLAAVIVRDGGAEDLLTRSPPFVSDTAARPQVVADRLLAGVPTWLLHRPPRLDDLEEHLPEVFDLLERHPRPLPVISNAPGLFPDHPVARSESAVEDWLRHGSCSTKRTVALVVVDWDRWARREPSLPQWRRSPPPGELVHRIRSKCPEHIPIRTSTAWVWLLPSPSSPGMFLRDGGDLAAARLWPVP